ncbi:FYVE, RhoGEF and PH domain-containing protein 6, partial [Stegodyphus mimosarum]
MSMTEDQKEKSGKTKPPLLPKPCLSSPSAGPGENVIPQMVITCADDVSEEISNAANASPESAPSVSEVPFANGQKEEEASEPAHYISEALPLNIQKEEKKKVVSAIENSQMTRDYAVEETLTELTNKVVSSIEEPGGESRSKGETISHSVVQRPLAFEPEKISQVSGSKEDAKNLSESLQSSQPHAPTTMQRPLVFDGTFTQIEVTTDPAAAANNQSNVPEEELNMNHEEEEITSADNRLLEEYITPVADSKPKSSSFSWMPSFPKLHSPSKDAKSLSDQDKKHTDSTDHQKVQEGEPTESKKDSTHGMKKFFDSFRHENQQTDKDKQLQQSDSNKNSEDIVKEGKHSILKIFNPDRTESDIEVKNVSPKGQKIKEVDSGSKAQSKDAKHHIVKFFDSLKQDPVDQKEKPLPEIHPAVSEISESHDASKAHHKDSKHSIKKFFESFKHDASDGSRPASIVISEYSNKDNLDMQTKIQVENSAVPEIQTVVSETLESHDKSKAHHKDSKHGIKKFFGSFKHDASDGSRPASVVISEEFNDGKLEKQTKANIVPETQYIMSETVEGCDTSKAHHKDSKHSIKKFFDSLKHDVSDKSKPISVILSEGSDDGELDIQPKANVEGSAKAQSVVSVESHDTSKALLKDSKHSIKKFFDSRKHDASDGSRPTSVVLSECSHDDKLKVQKKAQVENSDALEIQTVASEIVDSHGTSKVHHGDSKHSIKKFFGSFRHDASDGSRPNSTVLSESSDEDKIRTKTPIESSTVSGRETQSAKDIKEIPIIITSENQEEIPPKENTVDVPKVTSKDSLHSVKKFFDSFTHDSADTQKEKPMKIVSSDKKHKESFHGVKKFFDSFKNDGSEVQGESKSVDDQKEKNVTFSLTSVEISDENQKDNLNEKVKEEKHTVRKFFDAFKHESHELQGDNKAAKVKKDKGIKRSQSFKDYFEWKDKGITEGTEGQKESAHGMKNFFDSFKHEKQDKQKDTKSLGEPKAKIIKRSQSFKECTSEKESVPIRKSFFESFSISKASSQSHAPLTHEKKQNEHIYDVVEKPSVESVARFHIQSESKVINDLEGKGVTKDTEGPQGMKKLIESFCHKDVSIKSKDEKHRAKSENIYDKVDLPMGKHADDICVAVASSGKEQNKDTKDNLHGVKKFFGSFRPKDSFKTEGTDTQKLDKIDASKNVPKIQVDEPSTSVDTKGSMFSSFGDNILAMRDRVMQSNTKKNENISQDNQKFQEYDLQNAGSSEEVPEQIAGTFKQLDDFSLVNEKGSQSSKPQKTEIIVTKEKKVDSETAVSQPVINDNVQKGKGSCKVGYVAEPGTPETLYQTCCLRVAVLLRNKALEIVSDQTKSPPKKPPKPSAEAIAKARAAAVSRRLQELQSKGHSVGDNIPVGYDGIHFADDETESSCDYKDVENFDYIMDYELINRYKFDNKVDTFSVPSTCSGMTSYYTADNVTLKDETFSDAALETVSLGSYDSSFSKLSAKQIKNKEVSYSLDSISRQKDKGIVSVHKLKPSEKGSDVVSDSKKKLPNKKIPPPLPPKPVILPKQNIVKNNAYISPSDQKSSVSQCINGLSLSPRLHSKFGKDSVGTTKRPLMVAEVKGTEFTTLPQSKTKSVQQNQVKERKFDTVLKNESLRAISNISSSHPVLTSTKSSPPHLSGSQSPQKFSFERKISPQRPPPPVKRKDLKQPTGAVSPSVPEKPKRESLASPGAPKEKRTISPPRPPPPVLSKPSACPPRPPPPTIVTHVKSPEEHPSYQNVEDGKEKESYQKSVISPEDMHKIEKDSCNINLTEPMVNIEKLGVAIAEITEVESRQLGSETSQTNIKIEETDVKNSSSTDIHSELTKDISTEVVEAEKSIINVSAEHDKFITSSTEICVLDADLSKKDIYLIPSSSNETENYPKPPPRNRRIRSRTVEIVPFEKKSETELRRSQSLSDIDVEKRITHLSPDSKKSELKSLYTVVNKDGKKIDLEFSNLENAVSRPLPAPPPPPRKFRSLERKPKEKKTVDDEDCKTESKSPVFDDSKSPVSEHSSLRPPARKRKGGKQRFLSLGSEDRRMELESVTPDGDTKMSRSLSVPLKPERRLKYVLSSKYDENANVAFPVVADVHHSSPVLDECGNEILNFPESQNIPGADVVDAAKRMDVSDDRVSPFPRQKKNKTSRQKSHSSWYDENDLVEESWEVVDWDTNVSAENKLHVQPRVSMHRKSDPVKKMRQTSKFYVDVEQDTGICLVDKETSPLPLDCSEKSVQTSLETLSQGIASRDEQSDDTDELLDLAQTLQNELKTIINRHKSVSEGFEEDSNTPPVSASDSEKNLGDEFGTKLKKAPSIQSSTSELWPMSSSEESDGELPHGDTTNLTEVALLRKKKKIFYIAQEIMTSEEVFVDALKLLNVDFKAAVDSASKQKNSPVIPDDILSQILNHLPQLQHLNENLFMELKDRIDNWDKSGKIADIIVKMGPFLKLYSWYIHDFESNVALLEESKKKYPAFAQVVKDFEMSTRCKRLTLNHYMLKPIQRIPQYRLLLQEYLHHLPEDYPDYQDTVTALQIVSEVANHANESMKHGDNAQKLISIQNSIMGHKEIIKPGRLFIKEGELMKLSRKGMQPRWFVLFNDLLLYLTPVQQGLYRINHELPLTGMKVAIPIQQDYQNEFSIISVTRSFTLAARSQEERQEWIIALTKAIEENASKRSTFTNIRLQKKKQDKTSDDDEGAFVLGKKAPVWIPDARVTMCQLCTSEFTVTFRRHHCRACGKVVCSICSSNRISLPYLGNRIARVCDECHAKLGPGSSPCTESGETDSENQQIAVKPHLRTEHRHAKKGRRNLPSVLKEVCANDQGSTISGYLQKRVGKNWKKDWFVVKDKVLYEYKAS